MNALKLINKFYHASQSPAQKRCCAASNGAKSVQKTASAPHENRAINVAAAACFLSILPSSLTLDGVNYNKLFKTIPFIYQAQCFKLLEEFEIIKKADFENSSVMFEFNRNNIKTFERYSCLLFSMSAGAGIFNKIILKNE